MNSSVPSAPPSNTSPSRSPTAAAAFSAISPRHSKPPVKYPITTAAPTKMLFFMLALSKIIAALAIPTDLARATNANPSLEMAEIVATEARSTMAPRSSRRFSVITITIRLSPRTAIVNVLPITCAVLAEFWDISKKVPAKSVRAWRSPASPISL